MIYNLPKNNSQWSKFNILSEPALSDLSAKVGHFIYLIDSLSI